MQNTLTATAWGACLLLAAACGDAQTPQEPYDWGLPPGVEPPPVPADNPMSAEKVELGRYLFYDTRLAINENRSCGICHEDQFGFTDSFVRAVGSTTEVHPRNTLSLTNVGYRKALTWVEPELGSLEAQLLLPLLGDDPIVELGFGGREDDLIARLSFDPFYEARFAEVFPGEARPINIGNIARAIAAFERTLISRNSPFDRFVRGDETALSAAAKRGMALFLSDRTDCNRCHGGPELMSLTGPAGEVVAEHAYFNVGLYDVDGQGSYPEGRTGRFSITGEPADMGVVRVPTLRNVEVTGPWFSDGTGATLEDVIEVKNAGGRVTTSGPNVGDGRGNPFKSPLIRPLDLTEGEKADLLAFLLSLTDTDFLEDPRFKNPFPDDDDEENPDE